MKLNDNMIIHINNKRENQELLEALKGLGVEGIRSYYKTYKEKTCYHVEGFYLYYSNIDYYKGCNAEIVEFKDIEL